MRGHRLLDGLLGTASSWAQAGLSPSFGDGDIPDQVWIADPAIEPVPLPEASGGDGELEYTVSPELPEGLVFEGVTRTLSGTPTTPQAEAEYALFATDADGDAATLFFIIEVIEDLMSSFAEEVGDQIWTKNQEIEPLVLPMAEGGNRELEYTLEGELLEGWNSMRSLGRFPASLLAPMPQPSTHGQPPTPTATRRIWFSPGWWKKT